MDAPTFTLDTSGVVTIPSDPYAGEWTWERIARLPFGEFAQGYIWALFASIGAKDGEPGSFASDSAYDLDGRVRVGFSDLAGESLGRILDDCQRVPDYAYPGWISEGAGRQFWRDRQAGGLAVQGLPPLTPTLAEDGLVYLTERRA